MRPLTSSESITGAPHRFEALVTLHAAAEEIASRVPAYWGAIEPIDANTCEFRTGDDDLGWLALRIAMLGVDFEVHEPPELVEHLRALATRLGRASSLSRYVTTLRSPRADPAHPLERMRIRTPGGGTP